MPHFTFQALAPGGEQISGTLDAPTRRDAYRQIESRQLVPIQVAERSAEDSSNRNGGETRNADEPAIRLKRSRLTTENPCEFIDPVDVHKTARVYRRQLTPDLGGTGTTETVTGEVVAEQGRG